MPLRLRNYGKFSVGEEIKLGPLDNKSNLFSLDLNKNKFQLKNFDTRSGKTYTCNLRNKSKLEINSSFSDNNKIQEELKYRRILFEKAYKKIDELNYRTLSTFFIEEEKFFSKIIDEKRREEIMREIEIKNNEKENKLEVKSEIANIKIYDIKTNSSRYIQWSGSDVLKNKNEDDYRKQWNKMINSLEDFNLIIWNSNKLIKRFQKIRYAFYILATNDYFDYTILGIVIINSIFMAMDGNLLKPEILEKINLTKYFFNSIFIVEYIVKFIGLSPLIYYSDPFNYLDTFIIAFAIIEFALPSNIEGEDNFGSQKNMGANLTFLRVFRIFRILRMTKILKKMQSLRLIINSMSKAIASVIYIVIILIMFILIFELLGMSLLSGNNHYKSFGEGFYITYQILTLENWDSLLYELWNISPFSFIYYAIWIFFGNFIIFNLFTSVLLQAFGDDEKDYDLEEDDIIENMYALPDYLFNLKKAEKEHTKTISNQKRKSTVIKELFKTESDNSKCIIDNTTIGTHSNINKSQIERPNTITNEEFYLKNDNENNEELSEENLNRNISEVQKYITNWKKINKLFRKNECENSIYFLSQTNKFRIMCMKLINNNWFDKFILLMIIFSTARIIIDTFINGYTFALILDIVDIFLNTFFLLESITKICALGMALDEGSYLSDNWNKLDIILVLCSFADYQYIFEKYVSENESKSSSQFLKVLRLLRTLRPIRFISHNEKLKIIIVSLIDSILPITNALFIVIVIYYIFSIVGISLFYENFHSCYILKNGKFDLAIKSFKNDLVEFQVKKDFPSISHFCSNRYNGIMDTGPAFKFSNIGTSLVTSYVLSTQEGWPDIMNSYRIYGDYYGIFFIVYNLIVAYFFLNLFTGIMFKYFNEGFSKEKQLSPKDKKAPKYYDFLAQIVEADSHYATWLRPSKGEIQYYMREFSESKFLDNIITFFIFFNLIIMSINYEGCDPTYEFCLKIANYFFAGIFIAECIIKILAYNFEAYFHIWWNRFDFAIAIISIFDIIIENTKIKDNHFLKSFQILRLLKVSRVLKILRLTKVMKGLHKIIQTLAWSLSALADVFILMILIFGIFAALGCNLYDDIKYDNYKDEFVYINEYYNLDNFYNSFLLTFRCSTGENWNNIMMEYAYIDPNIISENFAFIYFIISNFIDAVIMLNIFLMVTLQQYDEFTNKKYNPIEKFEIFLKEFNNSWNKFSTHQDKGFRIKKGLIISFFMDYNWKKLNFPEEGKLDYIKKYVSDLKLRSYDEDYIYYHDLICKIIIQQLGSQVDRANPENILILKTEKKVQEKIRILIENYIRKNHNKENTKKNITITYNPLTSHLYFKTSYLYIKSFFNFYKENAEFLHQLENSQIEEQDKSQNVDVQISNYNSESNIALNLTKNKLFN